MRARDTRGAVVALLCGLALLASCGPAAAPPAPTASAPAAPGAAAPGSAAAAQPGAAPTPAAPESLRVAYSSISVTSLPAWVAKEAGTFAKHGLDVSLDYIPSGATLIQNMVAGGTEFGFASVEAALAAALAGAPLVVLAPSVDKLVYTVQASADVAGPAALRGRRFGITRAGSSTDFAARLWLPTLGLRPDEDVLLVQLGGQPEILAGLQAGAIDAGLLSPPGNMEARRLGLREIADLTQLPVQFYQASVVASHKVIEERPDLVRRLMRALVEANSVIHKDKSLTKQVIGRYTETRDDEVLESSYQFALPSIPRVPLPTRAVIESALELSAHTNPAARGADPERFYDARFVQELEDSGFIAGLYRN